MYKPIQNYHIAELIKERLTSPVACELTHIFLEVLLNREWKELALVTI